MSPKHCEHSNLTLRVKNLRSLIFRCPLSVVVPPRDPPKPNHSTRPRGARNAIVWSGLTHMSAKLLVHKTLRGASWVGNAPTCYKAPKWPDPEFPRKIPKYPPAQNSGLPEFTPKIPRKYRKNTPKIPKMRICGILSVFLGYFLGVPEFRPGGYFFGIFPWKFRVGPFGAL